jgi:hypothetical protein
MKTFTAIDPNGGRHETNSNREFTHASLQGHSWDNGWDVIGFSGSEANAKRAVSHFKSQWRRICRDGGFTTSLPEIVIVEVEAWVKL